MGKRPNKGVPWTDNDIWLKLMKRCKLDLRSRTDSEMALETAEYFFTQPNKGDEDDLTTFTGLMISSGTNPDKAAQKIFDDLPQVDQRRVCLLLRDAGYRVHPTYLRTDKFID